MSAPRTERHKCSLFEEEIPAITYNSGGTYTLGALLEVSRGGTKALGNQGVLNYTFGVTSKVS